MNKLITAAILLTHLVFPFCFSEDAPPQKVDLPKVLIIGDSISIGYTPYIKEALKGKADVTHHKGNAGPTIRGIDQIETWLGDTDWDVIHFNWGLWDIYGWEYVNQDRTPAMYEKRLETLVARLKKTGATLIWGTTTPVCPEAEWTMRKRFKTDSIISPTLEKQYLDTALRVMTKHKIQINDLYALIKPDLKTYALAPDNVHYTKEGYKKLGNQVAGAIEKNLKKKHKDFLTPEYYLSKENSPFREEVNRFLRVAQSEPFRHPLQNKDGTIPTYALSPWRTFGTEIGPRGGKKFQIHPADDLYIGNRQTTVNLYAVYDGVVSAYRDAPKYRHYLSIKKEIKDENGKLLGKLVTLYAHLDLDLDEKAGLKLDGKQIKKGDLISTHLYSGTNGGPHLHFEIRYYRPTDLGTEEFYGSAFGPGGKEAGLTKPSAGDWSLGHWNPDKGYGFGNPKNFGLIFQAK